MWELIKINKILEMRWKSYPHSMNWSEWVKVRILEINDSAKTYSAEYVESKSIGRFFSSKEASDKGIEQIRELETTE